MRFSTFTTLATLTTAAAATPFPPFFGNWRDRTPDICVSKAVAGALADGFAKLISAYTNADADRLIASNFADYSDSINVLAGIPLGAATFPSKEAFKAGQGAQPPVPLVIQAIDAVDCTTIALRWNATFGNPATGGGKNVKGNTNLEVVKTGAGESGWQISKIYTEFNSIIWLTNIGGTYTLPARP